MTTISPIMDEARRKRADEQWKEKRAAEEQARQKVISTWQSKDGDLYWILAQYPVSCGTAIAYRTIDEITLQRWGGYLPSFSLTDSEYHAKETHKERPKNVPIFDTRRSLAIRALTLGIGQDGHNPRSTELRRSRLLGKAIATVDHEAEWRPMTIGRPLNCNGPSSLQWTNNAQREASRFRDFTGCYDGEWQSPEEMWDQLGGATLPPDWKIMPASQLVDFLTSVADGTLY